jgi:hypothetical protein
MIIKDHIFMTVWFMESIGKLGPGFDGDKDDLCISAHSHRRRWLVEVRGVCRQCLDLSKFSPKDSQVVSRTALQQAVSSRAVFLVTDPVFL